MFAQSLEKTGMRPTILPLLTKLYSQPQEASGNTFTDGEKEMNSEEKYGILEKKLLHVCDKLGGNFVNEPGADVLADLTHTQEEINFVSSVSVKQWKSKEWYKQKSGFITMWTTFVHVVVKVTALMLWWNINVLGSIGMFHLKKHLYLQKLVAR